MLEIIISRAKKIKLPIIVCTTKEKYDDKIVKIAKKNNVLVFRGNTYNKFFRWRDCFNKFDIHIAAMIDGDDPLFDYNLYKKAVYKLHNSKLDFFYNPKNIVTGLFTNVFKKSAILKTIKNQKLKQNTDTDISQDFLNKSGILKKKINLKDYQKKRKIRLTIDYEEDYLFFKKVFSKIHYCSETAQIIKFLDNNRKISEINYFREKEFLLNKILKSK